MIKIKIKNGKDIVELEEAMQLLDEEKVKILREKLHKEIDRLPTDSKTKSFNYKKGMSIINKGREWWKERKIHTLVMIRMELNNGFHRSFTVNEEKGGFRYQRKSYYLDISCKYYDLDAKMYCYDFHESLSLPIKREIPVQDIRNLIKNHSFLESQTAINPEVLDSAQKSDVVQAILHGTGITDFFRMMRLIGIITMFAAVINLFLFLHKNGYLNGIL